MTVEPMHTALNEALRLDYTAAPRRTARNDLGTIVLAALAAAPETLSACVAVFEFAGIPYGTYCLDSAGYLHRVHSQPPPLAHLAADVAVLLGGPATASPADFRRLGVAAGVVSHHLAARLGVSFEHVTCDDETIAWPLVTVNGSMTHLTTVTGKDSR